MSDNMPLLRVRGLCKRFEGVGVQALTDIGLDADTGQTIALVGPSGCGKSTLLNLLGMLEAPTAGTLSFNGKDYRDIRPPHQFRASSLGFVFQFHHLVPTMTLAENVASPLVASSCAAQARRTRAMLALEQVGLSHRARFLPANVSGGERQRAAIARAIVNRPAIILADEPTGNLDSANGKLVFDLLVAQARQHQALVIVATHNMAMAAAMDRQLHLLDGRLSDAPPYVTLAAW